MIGDWFYEFTSELSDILEILGFSELWKYLSLKVVPLLTWICVLRRAWCRSLPSARVVVFIHKWKSDLSTEENI